jgi:two-component system cell cycle sensor histidine kinase/response regulator CckA
MTEKLRALIVEDSETDTKLLVHEMRRRGIALEFHRVEDADSMQQALKNETWNIILCDWSLPRFSALGALAVLKESDLDIPFIIVSGTMGEEMAVEAVRAGAHDYLLKDRLTRLVPAIERELREARARAERKQLEAQLLQAQKMDALGRLAGGIAHDFNNILMVILSEADLLREGMARGAEVGEHIDGITNAAQRAAALTRQLLTVSRRQPRNPRIVSLNSIVGDVKKMLDRILGEDIEVDTVLMSTSASIEADAEQIGQVLLNLAVNARDAMPSGGKLLVQTESVELQPVAAAMAGIAPGSYLELTVSDTGCGIDGDTIARIFEPFFTTKEVGKGTGLGLSTVFSIVRQSNGGIRVHSEPGKGTTFKIYFPRVDAPPQVSSPPDVPLGPDGPHHTVLVVDDDPHVRRSVCRLLSIHGFAVISAPDAATAIDIFREYGQVIDLVMTDLVMPIVNGRGLAKRLRELRPDVRVLFMSGFADQTVLANEAGDHDDRVIHKPFTGAEIARAIRRAIGSPSS